MNKYAQCKLMFQDISFIYLRGRLRFLENGIY